MSKSGRRVFLGLTSGNIMEARYMSCRRGLLDPWVVKNASFRCVDAIVRSKGEQVHPREETGSKEKVAWNEEKRIHERDARGQNPLGLKTSAS